MVFLLGQRTGQIIGVGELDMLWGMPMGIILAFLLGIVVGCRLTYEVMKEKRLENPSSSSVDSPKRVGGSVTQRRRQKTAHDPAK